MIVKFLDRFVLYEKQQKGIRRAIDETRIWPSVARALIGKRPSLSTRGAVQLHLIG